MILATPKTHLIEHIKKVDPRLYEAMKSHDDNIALIMNMLGDLEASTPLQKTTDKSEKKITLKLGDIQESQVINLVADLASKLSSSRQILTTSPLSGGGDLSADRTIELSGVVSVANGGSGTATPNLVPGSGITISGTWPNQTISVTTNDPIGVPGLIFWLSADQLTGLSDGDIVYHWPDGGKLWKDGIIL